MEIIRLVNITKRFKEVTAVHELSFSVEQGEVYGFLGQNGAGKSTTIRMLLTLIEPTSGDIEVFGMNLKRKRKEILRRVGAIIEKPDLYKYLTAFENLKIFALMSGIKPTRRQLMEQLEKVGLAARAKSKVKTYSQGMKQRLGLATALIHNPDLIILDEPINGLDPQGIADVRNLILHLSKEEKKTVFVSSHLLSEMELIADSMLIIDKGRKVAEGKVEQLFHPSETIVELETPAVANALQRINQSELKEFLKLSNEEKILFKIHQDKIPLLAKKLVELDIPVHSLQSKHSLEDYFLSLTTANQHVEAFKN
ncbi:MAG: bacitracin ABC transporter ATP-binding protein [Chitinophagaceae bacterium]